MELRAQLDRDWSSNLCNKEYDGVGSPVGTWMGSEPTTLCKSCNGHSFAMEARMRLDHLKSGRGSPAPSLVPNGTWNRYRRDLWEREEEEKEVEEEEEEDDGDEEGSVLDLVELIDVEGEDNDEESWLYESPKKQASAEKSQSALTWCRHVLDHPGPEVEAARRQLMNRLDHRPSSLLYRRPAGFHYTPNESTREPPKNTPHCRGNAELSFSHDSINTNYRLEDITDVRIMAQLQEASLRQDYVSTPAASAAPLRRRPEPPSYLDTTVDKNLDPPETKSEASPCWTSRLFSLSSSSCHTSAAKHSPKLARLHQQVTQFKLLKRARNQATSPASPRSPAQTSLRSLQAVRNSRSLDTDENLTANPTSPPASGPSSTRSGPGLWSTSAPSMSSSAARDHLVRLAAMKRPQRSQSLSPCRITASAKGYLSRHGRVFASPERSTPVAWVRYAPAAQR